MIKLVASYDFYEFLLKGSLENDIKLLDGDVIFVPFIENTVRAGGAFKRPGNYEIVDGETVRDVIELAGDFKQNVPKDASVEISYFDESSGSRVYSSLKDTES